MSEIFGRGAIAVWLVAGMGLFTGCSLKSDLEKYCNQLEESGVGVVRNAEDAARLHEWTESHMYSFSGRNLIEAIASISPDEREPIVRKLLKEEGIEYCPILDDIPRVPWWYLAQDGLTLPMSNMGEAHSQYEAIMFFPTLVMRDYSEVALIKEGALDPTAKEGGREGYLIGDLLSSLERQADGFQERRAFQGKKAAPVGILLLPDQQTDGRVIADVLYTAARAKFEVAELGVNKRTPPGDQGIVRTRIGWNPGGPYVSITPTGFTVRHPGSTQTVEIPLTGTTHNYAALAATLRQTCPASPAYMMVVPNRGTTYGTLIATLDAIRSDSVGWLYPHAMLTPFVQ